MNSKWPSISVGDAADQLEMAQDRSKKPLDSVGLAHHLSDNMLLMAQWARINCH